MRSWSAVSRRFAAVSAVGTLAVIGACAESSAPTITGPEVRGVVQALVAGTVYACVDGGPGTVSAAAGVFIASPNAVAVAGSPSGSSNVAIAAGTCAVVASANSSGGYTTFDVTLAPPAGYEFVGVSCVTGINAAIPDCEGTTVTTTANLYHGTVVNYVIRPVQVASACDRMTFGGFVLGPPNISYGGNVGYKNGVVEGNLNFVNHTTGDHIQVKSPLTYSLAAAGSILSQFAETRVITGTATINGAGSFPVEFRMTDLGEPGTNDRIYLSVGGNVVIPAQIVDGGNLQLHPKCK
ncbi:MAG TPA: post-COAP-1 domain-containing protein [Gemmatimonadaceae bacterium]|nr:post-COAP-1 domain-containing protein [Gemmatimonadaceae bacterium]